MFESGGSWQAPIVAAMSPPGPSSGAGVLLGLLRDGVPRTRSELVGLTGWSRSTVAHRVAVLLDRGLVGAAGDAASSGGRPPSRVAFDASSAAVLGVALGATVARLGVTDLAGQVVGELQADLDIGRGPEEVLAWVVEHGRALLARTVGPGSRLAGVGVGLPGPVEHATGRAVRPPLMPGWDGYDVVGRLRQDLGPVVAVDNDVNVMALGEHFKTFPEVEHLVFVKVGTGIGCGIIAEGALRRGAQGSAGDLGHMRVLEADGALCACGNTGCLEAVAGGGAVAARLAARGHDVRTSRDVAALARQGDPDVLTELRAAGRHLGEALADVVSLLNPSVIVVGGPLVDPPQLLLAGAREVVYERSLPLATQRLRIVPASTGDLAGTVGAAVMVIEHVLAPDTLDRSLDGGWRD